jgi:hypothetical protein
MPNTDRQLLDAVAAIVPSDPELRGAWGLVWQAIQVGWIDRAELVDIVARLSRFEGVSIEEVGFELRTPHLHVSFLRDGYDVEPAALIALMERALRGKHPGTITFLRDGAVVSVREAKDLPESQQFANTPRGPVPVVKVDARTADGKPREVLEYGENGELLRSTRLR